MRKLLQIPLLFLSLFTVQFVSANTVDSLYKVLEEEENISEKIHIYNSLADVIKDDADTALFYAKEALRLSVEINHPQHIINSYLSISNLDQDMGDFESAITYLFKAQEIADSLNHNELLGKIYNNLGNAYRGMENIYSAEKFYGRAIKLYQEVGNELELGKTYNNIGLVYVRQEKYDEAIKAYHKSLDIVIKFDDKTSQANGWSNLGVAHYYRGEIEKTIFYFKKSLRVAEETNNLMGVAISQSNIGELYFETRKFDAAIESLLLSIETSKKIKADDLLKHSYYILSNAYAEENRFEQAYEYNNLYSSLKDSINDVEKSKFSMELESKFASSEKEKKILALEKQQALNELELRKKKYTQNILVIGVVLVILLLLIFYIRYRSSKKEKELLQIHSDIIEQKNAEITESIVYAKRIQKAILPTDKFIKDALPNSFVLYKPKDIVAGDFYWVEQIDNYILFAVADCTGHGVPGAMVSVVCHNVMNRVIRDFSLLDPAKILDKTRELVVDQLNKSEDSITMDNIRDGMDIALCVLDRETNELNYAGANNPLWILRNGLEEMEEIKANKQSIGKIDHPDFYTSHKIKLNKGDNIYLFSDGYADQFGGEKGKKLKYKPFKKLLLSIKNKEMNEQGDALNQYFGKWQGDLEQVDDVCVMGVKI